MFSRIYRMQDLEPGLAAYIMHYLPEEPGYKADHYIEVVAVDEHYVYVRKHGSELFHYSDSRPSKAFLKLKKSLYDSDWFLSKGNI